MTSLDLLSDKGDSEGQTYRFFKKYVCVVGGGGGQGIGEG